MSFLYLIWKNKSGAMYERLKCMHILRKGQTKLASFNIRGATLCSVLQAVMRRQTDGGGPIKERESSSQLILS